MKVGATLVMALLLAAFVPSVSFAGAPDTDGDGIADDVDTCPLVANPTQTTPDTDGDGVPDACDNCLTVSNPNQCDSNSDGYGNRCDQDLNNNGLINIQDRVQGPFGFNPNFGATGAACTVDQDFDDTTSSDIVNIFDRVSSPSGFNPNFGANVSSPQRSGLPCVDATGGVAGSCPPQSLNALCYPAPSTSCPPF